MRSSELQKLHRNSNTAIQPVYQNMELHKEESPIHLSQSNYLNGRPQLFFQLRKQVNDDRAPVRMEGYSPCPRQKLPHMRFSLSEWFQLLWHFQRSDISDVSCQRPDFGAIDYTLLSPLWPCDDQSNINFSHVCKPRLETEAGVLLGPNILENIQGISKNNLLTSAILKHFLCCRRKCKYHAKYVSLLLVCLERVRPANPPTNPQQQP